MKPAPSTMPAPTSESLLTQQDVDMSGSTAPNAPAANNSEHDSANTQSLHSEYNTYDEACESLTQRASLFFVAQASKSAPPTQLYYSLIQSIGNLRTNASSLAMFCGHLYAIRKMFMHFGYYALVTSANLWSSGEIIYASQHYNPPQLLHLISTFLSTIPSQRFIKNASCPSTYCIKPFVHYFLDIAYCLEPRQIIAARRATIRTIAISEYGLVCHPPLHLVANTLLEHSHCHHNNGRQHHPQPYHAPIRPRRR